MPIRLDSRLQKIASLIKGGVVADIGCDHGKLGYYLLSTDRAESVIATDISAPSLAKAEALAHDQGVEDRLFARLGDGLQPIESGEADVIVIAGLGGDVISAILQRARIEGKVFNRFVLSPNTHSEKVREEIIACRHRILYDGLTECSQKYYTIISTELISPVCDNSNKRMCSDIDASNGADKMPIGSELRQQKGEELDALQLKYGKFYKEDEVLRQRAERELQYVRSLLSARYSDALAQKERELTQILGEVKND